LGDAYRTWVERRRVRTDAHRLSPTSHIGLYPGEDIASYTETPTTVIPLIKGHSLDKLVPSNYRPISNLNFISKTLERLFLSRFQCHILKSPNFNIYQSAYRPHCSTETALQLLLDHIYSAADDGKPTLLISLDLSAAFDTSTIPCCSSA